MRLRPATWRLSQHSIHAGIRKGSPDEHATARRQKYLYMQRFFLFLICAVLLLPVAAVHWPAQAQQGTTATSTLPLSPLGIQPIVPEPFRSIDEARSAGTRNQVRIERRIIIRIAPSSPETRTSLMSELPRRPMERNYEEVPHGDCVPAASIVGVQPMNDNRLLLFTRDRDVLTASLERGCSARAFYSGFYFERSDDGRLCIARDQLRSRAGTSCGVTNFTRLVAMAD